jgi:DNA-binding NtrC family response regulator
MALRKFLILRRPRKRPPRRTHGADPANHGFLAQPLRLARRSRPDLKVLFTTGYADLSRFGDKLRNHPPLRKPFKPETLAEAVQTALHGVYSDEPHNVVLLQRDRR